MLMNNADQKVYMEPDGCLSPVNLKCPQDFGTMVPYVPQKPKPRFITEYLMPRAVNLIHK